MEYAYARIKPERRLRLIAFAEIGAVLEDLKGVVVAIGAIISFAVSGSGFVRQNEGKAIPRP